MPPSRVEKRRGLGETRKLSLELIKTLGMLYMGDSKQTGVTPPGAKPRTKRGRQDDNKDTLGNSANSCGTGESRLVATTTLQSTAAHRVMRLEAEEVKQEPAVFSTAQQQHEHGREHGNPIPERAAAQHAVRQWAEYTQCYRMQRNVARASSRAFRSWTAERMLLRALDFWTRATIAHSRGIAHALRQLVVCVIPERRRRAARRVLR